VHAYEFPTPAVSDNDVFFFAAIDGMCFVLLEHFNIVISDAFMLETVD